MASRIDFNYFNALDLSVDFYDAAEKSFGQPHFFELIARRMIFLIKRQQDLRQFIQDLHTNVAACEMISLRQLLCSFLINCSDEVRVKCYQLLSANNPVPLIIDQGGEFFAFESSWIASESDSLSTTTRILSCGLEATCKGKSRLLNSLFCTSFEENEHFDNRFFNGTLDMQLVRDFGNTGNHLWIADAHGVIGDLLLEKMAGAFDAILVHLNESSCNLDKYIELIGKLASRVHKRLFVIVRDSKSITRENCCNQEVIKRGLEKVAALAGSVRGARIKLCSVRSLVNETQSKLYGSNLRLFVFDELSSCDNKNLEMVDQLLSFHTIFVIVLHKGLND